MTGIDCLMNADNQMQLLEDALPEGVDMCAHNQGWSINFVVAGNFFCFYKDSKLLHLFASNKVMEIRDAIKDHWDANCVLVNVTEQLS